MPFSRDKLILLQTKFRDPDYPGEQFYCEDCILMEGLLKAFPSLNHSLEVVRVAWPRPRQAVVEILGSEHQNLPVLILTDDGIGGPGVHNINGMRFVSDKAAILEALSIRHGIPMRHP